MCKGRGDPSIDLFISPLDLSGPLLECRWVAGGDQVWIAREIKAAIKYAQWVIRWLETTP